jgi:agmatine deiminase
MAALVRTLDSTPRRDGYFMPAEYHPHAITWMLWPERPDNWRLNARPAQEAFSQVAKEISRFEPVNVGVNPVQLENARKMLPKSIRVLELPNDDAWMRDCGPTFVIDGKGGVRGIDWIFNAWGGNFNGLYSSWEKDDAVPSKVFSHEGNECYKAPIVLEGGSIHVDGEGTCITTAECLLSPGRNPELSKDQIEEILKDYLNVEKVLWIPRGVFQDETSGHVDNMACFLQPAVLALTWTDNLSDPQYERSLEAYDYLMSCTDAQERKLTIHKIHQPNPVYISQE